MILERKGDVYWRLSVPVNLMEKSIRQEKSGRDPVVLSGTCVLFVHILQMVKSTNILTSFEMSPKSTLK